MDIRKKEFAGGVMDARIIINDIQSEIDLDGLELLKLEVGQPGARVLCTTGTLWLTQPGDPQDHLLKAGQSFTLNQRGIILVQGLSCGKALILPPPSIDVIAGASRPRSPQSKAHPLGDE